MPDTETITLTTDAAPERLVEIDRNELHDAVDVEPAEDFDGDGELPELTFGTACTGEVFVTATGPVDQMPFTPADLLELADALRWLAGRAAAISAAT